METVQLRAYGLLSVMQYDLDRDGAVTEEEIRRAFRYQFRSNRNPPQKYIDDTIRSIMALDTDNDGRVSIAEAGEFRHPQLQRSLELDSPSGRTRKVLTLESSTKGEITWQDYEPPSIALFRKVDADGDGKISPQERDEFRKTR